ncbi:protein phosphatase 2C domain-containing protein [Patescibacteria group bacterium]
MKSKLMVGMGTSAGLSHKGPHGPETINSHDAVAPIEVNGEVIGGVICDGCGTMPHSEVGAKWGVAIISRLIVRELENKGNVDWVLLADEVVESIEAAATGFQLAGQDVRGVINEFFLFTIMVVVAIDDKIVIASCGDGAFRIDEKVYKITSPVFNTPTYLSYRIVGSRCYVPDEIKINVVCEFPVKDLKKGVVIGSDGLLSLLEGNPEELFHPALLRGEGTQLRIWLRSKIFDQANQLTDDVSLVIIRTEEIQERLIQESCEIGLLARDLKNEQSVNSVLKSKIVKLEKQIDDLKLDLRRKDSEKDSILEKIVDLIRPPAKSIYLNTYNEDRYPPRGKRDSSKKVITKNTSRRAVPIIPKKVATEVPIKSDMRTESTQVETPVSIKYSGNDKSLKKLDV